MDMQHLTLVEGYSFERMLEELRNRNITPRFLSEPRPVRGFFRGSEIGVDKNRLFDLKNSLGKNYSNHPLYLDYHGAYIIEPGFDLKMLDGNIKFDKGRLIEKVSLIFL